MSRQPDIRYKELFRDLAVTPDKEAFLKKRVKSVLRERHGNPVCQTRRFPRFYPCRMRGCGDYYICRCLMPVVTAFPGTASHGNVRTMS